MVKAVIFDFDGVIADSEPLHYKAEQKLVEHYGKKFSDDAFNQTLGRSTRDVFEIYKAYFGISESIDNLITQHDKIFLDIVSKELLPVPGALELIKRVQDADLKFAIASSGSLLFIKTALKKFKLTETFGDRITSIEMVKKGKPEPDLFLHAAARLAVSPEYCLVIEDSTNGIKAAHKAGMQSLYFNITNEFPLENYNARRIKHLDEVTQELLVT